MQNKLYVKFEDLSNHQEVITTFFTLCFRLVKYYTDEAKSLELCDDFVIRGCMFFGEMARLLELEPPDDNENHNKWMESNDDN